MPEALLEVLDLELHLLAELPVERAERLVHQDQPGLEDQGAGQGHPLLLAAGELGRPPVVQAGQLDQLEGLRDAGCASPPGAAGGRSAGRRRSRATVMWGKSE